jgi:hypothetical protein
MSYPRDILDSAHRHSSVHRDELERSWICGCFRCCTTCAPAEIEDWVDDETTALCPNCGIDSVIGSASGYPVEDEPFLCAMRARWF